MEEVDFWVIVSFVLAIILWRPLRELVSRITEIHIGPVRISTWSKELEKGAEHAQTLKIRASHHVESAEDHPFSTEIADRPPRDVVVESWRKLKQTVQKVTVDEEVEVPPDLAKLSKLLYELGKQVADHRHLKPEEKDAERYIELVEGIRHSVRHPIAILVGTSGPVKGQQFLVNQEPFRIGAGPDNELCIAGDQFLSEEHALLRYKAGHLFVSDLDSLNKTFVNGQPIASNMRVKVHTGDRILVGASTLEVIQKGERGRTRVA